MNGAEILIDHLRDGDVISIPEADDPVRVHRLRVVSICGHPWLELLVSDPKRPLLPINDLYFLPGSKAKLLLRQ